MLKLKVSLQCKRGQFIMEFIIKYLYKVFNFNFKNQDTQMSCKDKLNEGIRNMVFEESDDQSNLDNIIEDVIQVEYLQNAFSEESKQQQQRILNSVPKQYRNLINISLVIHKTNLSIVLLLILELILEQEMQNNTDGKTSRIIDNTINNIIGKKTGNKDGNSIDSNSNENKYEFLIMKINRCAQNQLASYKQLNPTFSNKQKLIYSLVNKQNNFPVTLKLNRLREQSESHSTPQINDTAQKNNFPKQNIMNNMVVLPFLGFKLAMIQQYFLQQNYSIKNDLVVQILKQILLQVKILHQHQIVHGDLSPGNILLKFNSDHHDTSSQKDINYFSQKIKEKNINENLIGQCNIQKNITIAEKFLKSQLKKVTEELFFQSNEEDEQQNCIQEQAAIQQQEEIQQQEVTTQQEVIKRQRKQQKQIFKQNGVKQAQTKQKHKLRVQIIDFGNSFNIKNNHNQMSQTNQPKQTIQANKSKQIINADKAIHSKQNFLPPTQTLSCRSPQAIYQRGSYQIDIWGIGLILFLLVTGKQLIFIDQQQQQQEQLTQKHLQQIFTNQNQFYCFVITNLKRFSFLFLFLNQNQQEKKKEKQQQRETGKQKDKQKQKEMEKLKLNQHQLKTQQQNRKIIQTIIKCLKINPKSRPNIQQLCQKWKL